MVTLDQAGWNRSEVVVVPPPAPIAHVVEFLWIDERPRLSPRSHQWRVVPDDAAHLIYARSIDPVSSRERHRLHVVGARHEYTDIDCRHRVVTVGARLRAGAIPAMFRVAASSIADDSVDIASIVRPRTLRAFPQLDGTPRDVLIGLTQLLGDLASRGRPVDDRARWLAGLTTSANVRDIARSVGICDRALRAWSSDHLGMGLRRFMTIRRLHGALEARIRRPEMTWSRIAAAHGFADQSHLVRDCQTLLRESPGEFLTRGC